MNAGSWWTRAYWIGGWNFLALAWLGLGILIGIATFFAFSPWTRRDHAVTGVVAIAAGAAVAIADPLWRSREESPNTWRFLSPFSGGAVFFVIPAWLVGIGVAATGIVAFMGAT